MNHRLILSELVLLAWVLANGSLLVAEPPVRLAFAWSPSQWSTEVRPVASVIPAQYTACPPCPPVYSDVITDLDLQQMRDPRCVVSPVVVPQQSIQLNQPGFFFGPPPSNDWHWQLLPGDVIWHSYWAGVKEPRISGTVLEELHGNVATLDATLGGRAAVVRYGSRANGQPEGFEVQLEGAGMPRINLDENWDLESADFRFGVPLIYGSGRTQWKMAYYHLSSHLGDEFIKRTGIAPTSRVNYARDEVVLGFSFFPLPAWRWYAEAGWAFYADEGADPWEFQFGVDYAQPGPTGVAGTPFFAINGHLRQEVNYGGSVTAQAGWLWRGKSGRIVRTGLHYLNGKSSQFEFNNGLEKFEQQLGAGLWYDY